MNAKLTIIIPVIVITILVMGLTVIPSISTGASALTRGCLNGNGKPHPGHNQVCPPGLARKSPIVREE